MRALTECSDAIIVAIQSDDLPNYNPKVPIHPDFFAHAFTLEEVVEAQAFLVRLGIFHTPTMPL